MSDAFAYDVFLSHSSKDKEVVREIAARLNQDGLKVWLDEWVIRPGASIPVKVDEGLKQSRVLVLCISANSLGSDWATLESQTIRFDDPLNRNLRFIPLRLDEAPIEGSLKQFRYITWNREDCDRAYAELLEACRYSALREDVARELNEEKSDRQWARLQSCPRCFGRDELVADLTNALLEDVPPPSSVLGGPGIGKSNLCWKALHDTRVSNRYGMRRAFVRCDAATDRATLVAAMAQAVGVEAGPNLETRVLDEIERAPAVVVLDNFETPWGNSDRDVEDLLALLGAISGLALVVTIRGMRRPYNLDWRGSITVEALPKSPARQIFLAVAGQQFDADERLDALLKTLEGWPLAIELLANQAVTESNLAGLERRWQRKRADLLKRGRSEDRLSNLAVSVELSLEGPRMTAEGKRLLALLGQFPEGIARADLPEFLAGEGDEAAAVLRGVGLAFESEDRLRVLAPLRDYAQQHCQPAEEDLHAAVSRYAGLAEQLGLRIGAEGGAEAIQTLTEELGNIERAIRIALERTDPRSGIRAALGWGEFARFSGLSGGIVVAQAESAARTAGLDREKALCIEKLGDIALDRSNHEQAREHYEAALPLYERVGALLGQANCIWSLGYIAWGRSDHEQARERYKAALPLYERVGVLLGQANCIKSLGELELALDHPSQARQHFLQALKLYARISEPMSIGSTHYHLARIAETDRDRQHHVQSAREAWTRLNLPHLIAKLDEEFGPPSP